MDELEKIVIESFSINDLCIKIYGYCNGSVIKKINHTLESKNIDISHFGIGKKLIKYKRVIKTCPICDIEFKTTSGNRDEKTTCSNKCSNLYFHHGNNNPNFDQEKYKIRYEKVSKSLKGRTYGRVKIVNEKEKTNEKSSSCKSQCVINKVQQERLCRMCNVDISNKPKRQIFCSNQCRSKYPISVETKKKISDSVNNRIKDGTHSGWSSRNIDSYTEKFFKQVLLNNNIEFEFNKPIKKRDLGINCNCNYFLDFHIKNTNIDLEIDGKQHKHREDSDKLRDEYLIKNGYDVYRIKWKSINSKDGKIYIKNEIDMFINYYNSKINSEN